MTKRKDPDRVLQQRLAEVRRRIVECVEVMDEQGARIVELEEALESAPVRAR